MLKVIEPGLYSSIQDNGRFGYRNIGVPYSGFMDQECGLTFSEAKKTKMEKVTVEGADLAKEIAKKVNEDFDKKKLPLMLGMINAIVEDKKLDLNWELFR